MDYSLDEEGYTKIFASIYAPDGEESNLLPIETEDEWRFVEGVIRDLRQEVIQCEIKKE